MTSSEQTLTVIIATRNRGASIIETLKSAFAAGNELYQVIVIDQSSTDDTKSAIEHIIADDRLIYLHTDEAGLANARNIGIVAARSEVLLMTDDDCVLPEGYARKTLDIFTKHKAASLFFFQVEAAPYDPALGYTPDFIPVSERKLTKASQLSRSSGIGAGMAVRRSMIQSIGGFDPMMGAGGRYNSAEDIDISIRTVLFGHTVIETNALSIVHFGFRTHDEFRALVRRDWYGIGAAYAKPLRVGYWSFAPAVIIDVWRRSLKPLLFNMLKLRPRGIASLQSFVKGFWDGWRHPIDRKTLLFKP